MTGKYREVDDVAAKIQMVVSRVVTGLQYNFYGFAKGCNRSRKTSKICSAETDAASIGACAD